MQETIQFDATEFVWFLVSLMPLVGFLFGLGFRLAAYVVREEKLDLSKVPQ